MSKPVLGPPQVDDPSMQPVACAICGRAQPIALSYAIKVLLVNAPNDVPSFECPALAHWACTPEHATQAAHACLDEHIAVLLSQREQQIAAQKAANAAATKPTS